jgi:hypothetical protein
LNVNTGIRLQAVTNAEGIFRFPELPIGTYEITASKPGFQRLVNDGVDLLTAHTVDLKLQLKIGSLSESIEVTAESLLVQSSTSDVHTTIESRSMTELPLNGRNPGDAPNRDRLLLFSTR